MGAFVSKEPGVVEDGKEMVTTLVGEVGCLLFFLCCCWGFGGGDCVMGGADGVAGIGRDGRAGAGDEDGCCGDEDGGGHCDGFSGWEVGRDGWEMGGRGKEVEKRVEKAVEGGCDRGMGRRRLGGRWWETVRMPLRTGWGNRNWGRRAASLEALDCSWQLQCGQFRMCPC